MCTGVVAGGGGGCPRPIAVPFILRSLFWRDRIQRLGGGGYVAQTAWCCLRRDFGGISVFFPNTWPILHFHCTVFTLRKITLYLIVELRKGVVEVVVKLRSLFNATLKKLRFCHFVPVNKFTHHISHALCMSSWSNFPWFIHRSA
jgi:hypothetical protein